MPTSWLPALVLFTGDWDYYKNLLYKYFKEDFLDCKPSYDGCVVNVSSVYGKDGFNETFWHILHGNEFKDTDEMPQKMRWERIRWPRPIIERIQLLSNILVKIERKPSGKRNKGAREVIKIYFPEARYFILLIRKKRYVQMITAYPTSNSKHEKLTEEFTCADK
jgi:hypothetical protein